MINEIDRKEICDQIDYIMQYLDDVLHPIVSPDNYYVYAQLYDELQQLKIVIEQKCIK